MLSFLALFFATVALMGGVMIVAGFYYTWNTLTRPRIRYRFGLAIASLASLSSLAGWISAACGADLATWLSAVGVICGLTLADAIRIWRSRRRLAR